MFFLVLTLSVFLVSACVPNLQQTSGISTPAPDVSKIPKVTTGNCPAGLLLDNSGNCIIPPCSAGQARDNAGNCVTINPNINPGYQPLPLESTCVPTGYFKSAYAWHKGNVGLLWNVGGSDMESQPILTYQFVVTNECEANFYLEAGIRDNNAFTISVATPSACDGNPHYAGTFKKGNKNTIFASNVPAGTIDAVFYPRDYGKSGDFKVVGGVYSGCLSKGGSVIAVVPEQTISIRQANLPTSYSGSDISLSTTRIIG